MSRARGVRHGAARRLALALAVVVSGPVAAQTDSTAVPVAPDSLAALPVAPPAGPPVAPFALAGGRALGPVPATTAALDLGMGLADVPGAFGYAAGAPGHTAGTALDGLGPEAPGLALDGRPLHDLVTGAPRIDLLPLALLAPLVATDGAWGRALGVAASTRDLRLAVPVTELRYLGGQDGIQHVSGSHSQTRLPPAFLRGGSRESRLTVTGHAASRSADAPLDGGDLAHTDAGARLLLTRPGLAVETGVLYADRTVGARTGVIPTAGQPLAAIFNANTATVLNPSATRRTLRTEGWLRARVPLFDSPTEAGLALATQRLVFAPGLGADTVRVHAARWAGFVEQPVPAGAHAVRIRVDVTGEPSPGPVGGAPGGGTRVGAHAVVSDSVRVGVLAVALAAGAHAVGGDVWPSASVRVASGAAFLGVRLGGRERSRLAEVGLPGRVLVGGGLEQTLAADAGATATRGDWRATVRAFASGTEGETVALAVGDSLAQLATALDPVLRVGGTLGVGWREATERGLYARAHGTTQVLSGGGALGDRLDAALPRAWGDARLGVRADDVGDGVLDLDLAVRLRAWTDLRSRRIEPTTGLLLLADASGDLGPLLPARALVGLDATATFQTRASLFVRYDHALGERAYGAVVTQGEPLAPHVLRFGVFWALLD